MSRLSRRAWLRGVGLAAGGAAAGASHQTGVDAAPVQAASQATGADRPSAISLLEYQPKSMLHVAETRVDRARHPAIDIHTHLSFSRRDGAVRYTATPAELLPVMDRRGVQMMVNLTGGTGPHLAMTVERFDRAHPGRFLTFTEPSWSRVGEPGYPAFQADEIAAARRAGARGVKVLKLLGLYLREGGPETPLIAIDDRRFDQMWDACGALGLPVAIHVSDPEAFFLPADRFNERYEELYNHPDWSFHGPAFRSNRELLEACDRVFARHPKTQFLALHVGHNAENLSVVSARLDRFPHMTVELGARLGELGRQPRAARAFFDKYQDRILFGTDAVPSGTETPQQTFGDELYSIYYRFLETEDEYFDYAPAPVPPQGRWRIYGLGLPDQILRKVYRENAARLLGLEVSG